MYTSLFHEKTLINLAQIENTSIFLQKEKLSLSFSFTKIMNTFSPKLTIMLKTICALLLLFPLLAIAQQNTLSTVGIGNFTLNMKSSDAEKQKDKKTVYTAYEKFNNAKFAKDEVHILYNGEASNAVILELRTQSSIYKTKSSIGVGSTRKQLFDAYISSYPNFRVNQGYNVNGKQIKNESYFSLEDRDANSMLNFKIKDDIVTEISVFYIEGC